MSSSVEDSSVSSSTSGSPTLLKSSRSVSAPASTLRSKISPAPLISGTLIELRKSHSHVEISSWGHAGDRVFSAKNSLFETSVTSPVKIKGFLRVLSGDIVTVLDIQGGPQGVAFVRFEEEMGKVPVAALLIDHHCYNPYLQANIKILLQSPSLFHLVCAMDEPMADCLVETLSTRSGSLVRAIATLVAIEVMKPKKVV